MSGGVGTVLYQARPMLGVRIMVWVATTVLGLLPAVIAVAAVVHPDSSLGQRVGGLIALLVIGVAVTAVVRGMNQRFVVSTEGILIANLTHTRWIPWSAVGSVEIDQRWRMLGATVVVEKSGRRTGSALTGARYAIRRGESTHDHGPRLRDPARPTRAALAGHRDYLSGRFARAGGHGQWGS